MPAKFFQAIKVVQSFQPRDRRENRVRDETLSSAFTVMPAPRVWQRALLTGFAIFSADGRHGRHDVVGRRRCDRGSHDRR